ncbi:MAG TPA: transglutaminase domain-containing protein, partial [Myxococcaceae bacterium]|nr:transglutaminase domain-containing protein [Myxococcaceae bacterium]
MSPWLALVLAMAPQRATFLFSLGNVPVGVVTLTVGEARFTYRSEHLFTRGADRGRLVREQDFTLAGSRVPESLWLWSRPAPGCVSLLEELTGRTGEGCAQPSHGDEVTGTVLGEAFQARYQGAQLRELAIGSARFQRVSDSPRVPAPPDLFGAGFAIDGARGDLALAPPGQAAEVLLPAWELGPARALAER